MGLKHPKSCKQEQCQEDPFKKSGKFWSTTWRFKNNLCTFIWSILEQSAIVWHSSLSEENIKDLERVQKSAIRIILKEKYKGYKQSLAMIGLEDLETRRKDLCLGFAGKCVKKIRNWFICSPKTPKHIIWIQEKMKYTKYIMQTLEDTKNHPWFTCKVCLMNMKRLTKTKNEKKYNNATKEDWHGS